MKRIIFKFWSGFFWFILGLCVGIPSALSFIRTDWENFRPDFFFWVSILTTIISLLLLCFSIVQYLAALHEKKKGDAQVKIWMQDANGLYEAMGSISVNCYPSTNSPLPRYSSVPDVGMAIYSLRSTAQALYQSLYEERCVTEEEYKAQKKQLADAKQEIELNKLRSEATKQ